MRKLFVSTMISLDGYFEGIHHDLSWHNVDASSDAYAIQMLEAVDTLVFGRVTYELMASYWPTATGAIADLMNSKAKIVCSRTLKKTAWANTKIVNDPYAIKQSGGGDSVILGSSKLCVSLLEAGLIDECRLMLVPIFLGQGTAIFEGLSRKIRFELLDSLSFASGNVLNTYRPLTS